MLSDGYSPEYLKHYAEAGFERFDPLIKMVVDGVNEPVDWWGRLCEDYKQKSKDSREVMDVSRSYSIHNGVTIPLMSDARGVAGTSLISRERVLYQQLIKDKLPEALLRIRLFHSLVMSNNLYLREFVQPLFCTFSDTQLRYVMGLVSGKKTAEIAKELGTSAGYLEQTMLKLRRKMSGAQEYEPLAVSRNEVLYYAGLFNVLDNAKRNFYE